jgi:hypothetical protein
LAPGLLGPEAEGKNYSEIGNAKNMDVAKTVFSFRLKFRIFPPFSVPAWLRCCNGNVVELLHAIDVGNSDGKTAVDICKVGRL